MPNKRSAFGLDRIFANRSQAYKLPVYTDSRINWPRVVEDTVGNDG